MTENEHSGLQVGKWGSCHDRRPLEGPAGNPGRGINDSVVAHRADSILMCTDLPQVRLPSPDYPTSTTEITKMTAYGTSL